MQYEWRHPKGSDAIVKSWLAPFYVMRGQSESIRGQVNTCNNSLL